MSHPGIGDRDKEKGREGQSKTYREHYRKNTQNKQKKTYPAVLRGY
jgi:hypothetical protein